MKEKRRETKRSEMNGREVGSRRRRGERREVKGRVKNS